MSLNSRLESNEAEERVLDAHLRQTKVASQRSVFSGISVFRV